MTGAGLSLAQAMREGSTVWFLTTSEHAGLCGLARSARAELPALASSLGCIHLASSGGNALPALAQWDCLRALHASGEWDVTQTVGALKVPRLVASKATPSDSDAPIEVQSTHLLTGGTGGLGLLTARWLAQEGVSTLVLASRTGRLPANASKEVELIRAAGARKIIERTT